MKVKEIWLLGLGVLAIIAIYSYYVTVNEEENKIEGYVEQVIEGWPAWTIIIKGQEIDIKGQYLKDGEYYYPD